VPAGRPALQDWLEVALWAAIFLAALLTTPLNEKGEANGPGEKWIRTHTGGGLCLWKRATGIECPGCGLSRGFVQIAHGKLIEAVKLNPFSPIIFLLLAARFLHVVLFCLLRRDVRNRIPWWLAWKFYGTLGAGFALLGVYRVVLRFT